MLVSTSRCLHYTLHAHVVYLPRISCRRPTVPVSPGCHSGGQCPGAHSVHTQESDTHGEGESEAVTLPGTETQHSQYLGDMRLLSSEHLFIMSVDG